MSTQNSITAIAHCHHRQRRLLRQVAATNARRRPLPSETFRFAPSRRSSLRSFRVLATLSLAPALHAVPSRHPFTWPWAAMGFARAQPAACLAAVLLAAAMLAGSLLPQPFADSPRAGIELFQIVLGFTPRRRPWKACPSQNDDFLPRFGIHPLQTAF